MEIILGKKYIDRMGNISVVKLAFDFYGKEMDFLFIAEHIDNVKYPTKSTVGIKEYQIFRDTGMIRDDKKTVIDLYKRFTLRMQARLFFDRLIYKLIPKGISNGFEDDLFDVDIDNRIKRFLK